MKLEFWANELAQPAVPFGSVAQGELNGVKRRLVWTVPDNQAQQAQEFAKENNVGSPIPPSTPDPPPPPPPSKVEITADITTAISVADLKVALTKMLERVP